MQELIVTTPEELRQMVSNAMEIAFAKLSLIKPTAPQFDLMTRKEAASLLGVSLVTLNHWSKTGVIKAYYIGTRVRYKRDELEQSLLKMQQLTPAIVDEESSLDVLDGLFNDIVYLLSRLDSCGCKFAFAYETPDNMLDCYISGNTTKKDIMRDITDTALFKYIGNDNE